MIKDYNKEVLEAKYVELSSTPEIIKAAKVRIKQRESVAELELGALTVA